MNERSGKLQMYFLRADGLTRGLWDGRSERLDALSSALEGETVREIAQDASNPKRIYAATLTEIHVGDDGGRSWKFLKNGLPEGHVHMTCGFAHHPDDGQTLCVGYTDGSVYASNNAGDSWHRLQVAQEKLYGVRVIRT